MNLTVTSENKIYTIAVSGRIDTLTAPELESKFREIENDADKLIFDMSEVEYISSAGMRVIVAAHRAMAPKDGLVLKGLTKNVSTIINLTGFNKILNIEEQTMKKYPLSKTEYGIYIEQTQRGDCAYKVRRFPTLFKLETVAILS